LLLELVSNTICMLSLEQCKKILNKNGRKYNEEEIKKIRAILYKLAGIEYDNFKNKKRH